MTAIIDLASLPKPKVIEEIDKEQIIAEMKADLIELFPSIAPVLALESALANKIMQVCAFRETLIRARENDDARALLLAFATGSDLDQLAGNFGEQRLVVTPAGDGKAAVMESDDRLRRRVQLRQAAYSVAGPADAYIYWALTAAPTVADATAIKTAPGSVRVTLMMPSPDLTPSVEVISAVNAALSAKTVRPLTDMVTVRPLGIIRTSIIAELTLYPGPNEAMIVANAMASLNALLTANARLGRDLRRSAIFSRLHVEGVQSVNLISPAVDIVVGATEAFKVDDVSLKVVGRDE